MPNQTATIPTGGGSSWSGSMLDLVSSLPSARKQLHAAGTHILTEGQVPDRIVFVADGTLQCSRRRGKRTIVLSILRSGDVAGDDALFTRAALHYDVQSLTDVLVIDVATEQMLEALRRLPGLQWWFTVSLAQRNRDLQGRFVQTVVGEVSGRLAKALLTQADGDGMVCASQRLLAELLGSHRTSVNRCLKEWESDGLVRLSYRRIEILDPAALADFRDGRVPEDA
jgi:CRP-like cAMP-binding protein